ncbi:hypothetical protein P3T35_008044 [Kitasatospora sp. GP30]|uniref:hypothetical protein n=1 Tax=Kitasatospora sp. GP30 TaxID=3035084 RepID=UPI000C7042B4|nr:hypothetical protein [Kitasatospora sp. GP30]MDH6145982.1 hypothetical protein [Kitasatospora sp. GP30]
MRYDIVFNAPTAAEAYEQAPPLAEESATVAGLLRELEPEHRPAYLGTALPSEEREVLLRRAACADRQWWATRNAADGLAAVAVGFALMQFDQSHPDEVGGPIGPDSVEWDAEGGVQAYVRQEYQHWLTVPPGCADPCPEADPCVWHAR